MAYITPKNTRQIQNQLVTWLNSNLDDPFEQATGSTRDTFVYGDDFKLRSGLNMPTIHVDCEEFTPTKITAQKVGYCEEEEHQIIIYYYNQNGHKYVPTGDLGDDANALTMSSSLSATKAYGFKITPSVNLSIKKVTKNSSATCTKAYVYYVTDEGTEVLKGSAAFSGDEAEFDNPIALEKDKSYYVLCDAEESSFTVPYSASPAYPVSGTYISWTTGATRESSTITDDSTVGPVITQIDFGYEALADEVQCREYLEYIKTLLKGSLDDFDEYFHKTVFGTIPKPTRHASLPIFVSMLPMTVYTYRR